MSTNQTGSHEVHPLVFLSSVMYALLVISLLFLYWEWVFGLAA